MAVLDASLPLVDGGLGLALGNFVGDGADIEMHGGILGEVLHVNRLFVNDADILFQESAIHPFNPHFYGFQLIHFQHRTCFLLLLLDLFLHKDTPAQHLHGKGILSHAKIANLIDASDHLGMKIT